MTGITRGFAAAFLVAHGVAHLIGFLAAWRLATFPDAPYATAILGGAVDVGDAGVRIVGLLWVAAAAGFVVAAVALWRSGPRAVVVGAVLFSLGVTVIGLPAAIVGLWIDVGILAMLAARGVQRTVVRRDRAASLDAAR